MKPALIITAALLLIILAACMTNYYDKFGGYPLGSETFTINQDGHVIKLLAAYRFPYQKGYYDSTNLNITVRISLARKKLKFLSFQKLTLVAADNSYLYSYSNPSVYDEFGKYPIRSFVEYESETISSKDTSDQLCIFTVSRSMPDYNLFLNYTVLHADGSSETVVKSFPINISGVKSKTRKPAVIYEDD